MMEKEAQEYIDLARACYDDDFDKVEEILGQFSDIDLDKPVSHSKSRGNGTPLILIASPKIARLLVSKGANVNVEYKKNGTTITALDSAKKELTKVSTSVDVKVMVKDYIVFLKEKGAKTYEELKKDGE